MEPTIETIILCHGYDNIRHNYAVIPRQTLAFYSIKGYGNDLMQHCCHLFPLSDEMNIICKTICNFVIYDSTSKCNLPYIWLLILLYFYTNQKRESACMIHKFITHMCIIPSAIVRPTLTNYPRIPFISGVITWSCNTEHDCHFCSQYLCS